MSEQTVSETSQVNPRTARAVAAILGQTQHDELLSELNNSDGRNQSGQASYLNTQSPFLREIYERGGTIVDGILTFPKENLNLAPEIEITTTIAAVKRLTQLTGDAAKAKELAPQLVEMGTRIAGQQSDGETRLLVFRWLYRSLEGKQELLENESKDAQEEEEKSRQIEPTGSQFNEKWQQIVELSEALTELEPKDHLPQYSFDELSQTLRQTLNLPKEHLTQAEIDEDGVELQNEQFTDQQTAGGSLIGFERIDIETDLPKIPKNLYHSDFEKLLGKMGEIDSQLERGGLPPREILAPFANYVELTKLDDELRQIEEEYTQVQAKKIDGQTGALTERYLVPKREELLELTEDNQTLDQLRKEQAKLQELIINGFDQTVDREKVENSISAKRPAVAAFNSQTDKIPKTIELTADEAELQELLIKEKTNEREIETLAESIAGREKYFRPISEIYTQKITAERREELTKKILGLELTLPSLLTEKYPELSPAEKSDLLENSTSFEIRDPAEYLFVREAAAKQFQTLRDREMKKAYRQFENKNSDTETGIGLWRREKQEHQEKIKSLKSLEPAFIYKIEGSHRKITGKPSMRAVAGYEFASQYVHYQLRQPETRLRHESVIYRGFAKRLELAKTAEEVWRESYKIRQENHLAAGFWKNAAKEERDNFQRPLSKNELTLLFLEPPPRHYTSQMSLLKYNFAHFGQTKEQMTIALQEGKLEPSADAQRLIESLESRLKRRNLETKQKATKHFFESLKTENEKLIIKNDFDHHAVFQKLPPHEKDWLYQRASFQKENLQYKIAYQNSRSSEQNLKSSIPTMDETAKSVRDEFAVATFWQQALILSNQKEETDPAPANTNEKLLSAVGFLIHNQTTANNLRVGEWLEKQKSEELQTAGEVLKTFARATRQINDNQMTVTVKFTETDKVSAADYRELFARYFPPDFAKQTEFRIGTHEKFKLENSRRAGQMAALNELVNDFQSSIYSPNSPVSVFENETRAVQEIEKIKSVQIECRRAVEIQSSISLKYEEKLKQELSKTGHKDAPEEVRRAVKQALLSPQAEEKLSNSRKAIFEKAQNMISISDFEKFSENAERLTKGLFEIGQSFEKIAAYRLENLPYYHAPTTAKNESLQRQYENIREQSEIELLTITAREKLQSKTIDHPHPATITELLSKEEQEKASRESYRQARILLEPKEINEPDINSEITATALEFADALEEAHQQKLLHSSETKTAELFTIAEEKRRTWQETLKGEKEFNISRGKPVTLSIYERELLRNKMAITRGKISQMIESGKLSLADLETKKAVEIFSPEDLANIKMEAGERTRENLEPKELWANRQNLSENLQQAALQTSDLLEQAHEVYHSKKSNPQEISKVFSALDAGILKLKAERRAERNVQRFINFKTDFKRDLANMFESTSQLENSQILTAMTKGLLIDGLEKQNIKLEKICLSGEKLSEISRTITLALIDDKKREKLFGTDKSSVISHQAASSSQTENIMEKQNVRVKSKQFEHTR